MTVELGGYYEFGKRSDESPVIVRITDVSREHCTAFVEYVDDNGGSAGQSGWHRFTDFKPLTRAKDVARARVRSASIAIVDLRKQLTEKERELSVWTAAIEACQAADDAAAKEKLLAH